MVDLDGLPSVKAVIDLRSRQKEMVADQFSMFTVFPE